MDRHRESVELSKTLAGIVAAACANFGFRSPEKYLRPSDFVGGIDRERPRRTNRKQQIMKLRSFLNSQVTRTVRRGNA
jgi:hypothetical protein